MKAIGKDGRVFRLSKESWEMLIPYDSDPNAALRKIKAELKAAIRNATLEDVITAMRTEPGTIICSDGSIKPKHVWTLNQIVKIIESLSQQEQP
jgi:hypothetical protein